MLFMIIAMIINYTMKPPKSDTEAAGKKDNLVKMLAIGAVVFSILSALATFWNYPNVTKVVSCLMNNQ